ncbi:MAG: JAB domain-containing protein [Candidatus Scatovivens sp.]
MSNKNVRVIYKKIEPEFLKKYGYVNLNHREINTKDELVELSAIFRNPIYETFRIIYMNKNKIVGHESITTKTPNFVRIFPKSKNGYNNSEKCFYKIKNRMERLNSDSYYMIHNHPSGNAKSSIEDLQITERFYKKVEGFKGHLIINLNSYAWIDIDKKGKATSRDYIPIKKQKKDKFYKMMNKKTIYDVQIKNRDDLVYLMHHIKNSKDYSIAILTDCMR